MILIAYDGSENSQAAVDAAARLFPGGEATVLSVWQRFIDTMARAGTGFAMMTDYDEIDDASKQAATKQAAEGARRASDAGLRAVDRIAVVQTGTPEAILHAASEVDAQAIVLGTRGLTGVKSLMMGSTSHHVLQHSDRPVIVVPSPALAAERAKHLSES